MPFLHAGQGGLHQRQGGTKMELAEGRDVFRRHLLDQIGPDDAGIMDDVGDGMSRGDILRSIRRRLGSNRSTSIGSSFACDQSGMRRSSETT